MNKGIIIAVVVLLAIGGGIFFLSQSNKQTPQTSTQSETQNTNTQENNSLQNQQASPSGSMEGEVKEITVEGSNFKFMPTEIKVKTGDTVRITFKNTQGFHDFVIDEFDVATKQIQENNTDVVEFTADKPGTYEYYCSVGQHRQMGMKGTLIVE